ncbi:MAG: hypothetical protein LBV00_00680 [Propionibacteriaceae bacterium]|nr:hypothetical protein [Propionibacteriaceae bacterium]
MKTPEEQDREAGVTSDLNLAYQETLSSAERQAYGVALLGDYSDPAGTFGDSCSGKAAAQFPGPSEPDRMLGFETEFGALRHAAWSSVSSDDRPGGLDDDSRVLELDGQWASCMHSEGYVFEGRDVDHGPMLAMNLAMRTRPDGTVGQLHHTPIPTSEIPDEEKSLVGTEPERKVALADFDCRVETDYMARLASVRVERDEQFIAEHKAELDRLVAAAESW